MGLVPSRGQSLRLILPLGGIQLNLPKGRYISNHHQKNQKPSFNYSILYHYFFCTIFCTRFFRSFDFYNTAHEQFHAISLSTTIIEAKNAFQYIHRILLIICFFFQLRYIVHHHTIYVLFLVRFYYFGRDRWRNIFVPDRNGFMFFFLFVFGVLVGGNLPAQCLFLQLHLNKCTPKKFHMFFFYIWFFALQYTYL
ncbi:hypothetical protein DFH27DRAFT_126380 [Peziza echinospora]|nr:hypothetical protein DFH27DRAFT_126380 [Peziza echinospora]